MQRFVILILVLVISSTFTGCGGGDGEHHDDNYPPQNARSFSITEWTFPDNEPTQTVVEGDEVHVGVQFTLGVEPIDSEEPPPISEVKDIRFFKDGEPYEPVSWYDSNICNTFYRIDDRDANCPTYRIEGTLIQDDKEIPVCREFTLIP